MSEAESAFEIRRATADDEESLAEVFENSPDGGKIGFVPQFRIDPYVAYNTIRENVTGFIAETRSGEPAGAGFVSIVSARLGGNVRDCAILDGLAVREQYRGQGLGKQLAAERVDYAESKLADDGVILAYIQEGNDPSKAVAESWSDQFAYEQVVYALDPNPDGNDDHSYNIREIRDDEIPLAVDRANSFYSEFEMYSPLEPDRLRSRLADTPLDEPVARYIVAEDGNDIVAGTLVLDQHKLMWAGIEELPPELQDADELPPSIPESREIRMRTLGNIWYDDGYEEAGKALVDATRANPGNANRIILQYDPDGPVDAIVRNEDALIRHQAALRGLSNPQPDQPTAFIL